MKYRLLPLLIVVGVLSLYGYYRIILHVLPNTYISYLNVSGMSKKELEKKLDLLTTNPVKIRIKNRTYTYHYKDLGVYLDRDTLINTVYEPNKLPFPKNILAYYDALTSKTLALPTFLFANDYYNYAQGTIFDFSTKADEIVVDDANKSLSYVRNEEKYTIEPESLKNLIVFNFGETDLQVEPTLTRLDSDQKRKALTRNEQLEAIFSAPIHLIAKDHNNILRFTIPPPEIKKAIKVSYEQDSDRLSLNLNEEIFKILMSHTTPHLLTAGDRKISIDDVRKDFISLIRNRVYGNTTDTILAKVDYSPNTDGAKAPQYIEVDISQQSMYLFKNKTMVKKYRVSTGLYYPTPVGTFSILNKAVNAFSNIYNVWMPYWMAFGYSSELGAYFGIHELPYWVDEGQKIQRPAEFIGTPNTGGCVALGVKDSKDVYDFAYVGMPVYIFN